MPEFTVSEHSPAAEEFVSLRKNYGQSIAKTLIKLTMDQIYSTAPEGAMIGLLAAKEKKNCILHSALKAGQMKNKTQV